MTTDSTLCTTEQLNHLQQLTAADDEKAFEQLYRLHKDRVYEIALAYTQSTVLAEEVLQDIFVQVWIKRTGLPAINNFSAWLFTLTRNRSFNVLRGIARAGISSPDMINHIPLTCDTADARLHTADIENLVRDAMQLLTPAQQTAFELSKLKGLSREEVAAAMNIAPNTAKVHLLHAMRVIRAYLVGKNVYLPAAAIALPLFL